MVGKTQDFLCVSSTWSEKTLMKNLQQPNLWCCPLEEMLFITVFTPGAALLCCHTQKLLVQMVCAESMRALPGCSLMEESQWMGHMGTMGNTQSRVHLSAQPRPLQRTPDLWLRMDARRCQGSRNGDFLFGGQGINKVC